MFYSTQIVLLVLGLNAIGFVYTEIIIKGTKLICIPNYKYLINHTCRLKAVNRYKSVVFMDAYIRNQLNNVTVNAALYARNDVNTYNPFLINFTQNICWYLCNHRFGTYMKVFMDVLFRYTNVNHSCPYEVNIALYARNDVNTYNPFLVNFTQNICWYLGQKQFGTYMKVFMDVLTQYTNVNHSCPYSGLLIARNLYLEGNSISALFPKGTYKGYIKETECGGDGQAKGGIINLVAPIKAELKAAQIITLNVRRNFLQQLMQREEEMYERELLAMGKAM
uniref:Uncharacterized protein n=1 Tax=Musca domestica TaxID=7370 RepID=A0A1I8N688_MUSDO